MLGLVWHNQISPFQFNRFLYHYASRRLVFFLVLLNEEVRQGCCKLYMLGAQDRAKRAVRSYRRKVCLSDSCGALGRCNNVFARARPLLNSGS
jgi:hypothetical protein